MNFGEHKKMIKLSITFIYQKLDMKYYHNEKIHNKTAPDKIVPFVIELIKPNSVVDIGCGLGNFLHSFKSCGVTDVLGVDGPWVNKDLLSKYLDKNEFYECDLEQELNFRKNFDLVVNLEVAEHLSPEAAEIHVKNLVNAGKIILFSAAIPGQGGQNHLNEQWLSFWEKLFNHHGYIFQDLIRPFMWNEQDIEWWYRQNMIFVTPKDFEMLPPPKPYPILDIVHPELFRLKDERLQHEKSRLKDLLEGKAEKKLYLKLLLKSFLK